MGLLEVLVVLVMRRVGLEATKQGLLVAWGCLSVSLRRASNQLVLFRFLFLLPSVFVSLVARVLRN